MHREVYNQQRATPSAEEGVQPSGFRVGSRVGDRHAQVLGLTGYGLGIVMMLMAFLWLLSAVQSGSGQPGTGTGIQPLPAYANWGLARVVFVLEALLVTCLGWLVAGRGAQMIAAIRRTVADKIARAGGIGIFCGGIALVCLVFADTIRYFGASPSDVPLPTPPGQAPPDYAAWTLANLFRILYFGILALNGSLIAGRGVQLFAASLSTAASDVSSGPPEVCPSDQGEGQDLHSQTDMGAPDGGSEFQDAD